MAKDDRPLVKFIYVDVKDGIGDREFTAHCSFLPRVGDFVLPGRGKEGKVVVKAVVHRFLKLYDDDEFFRQQASVLLDDPDSPLPEEGQIDDAFD